MRQMHLAGPTLTVLCVALTACGGQSAAQTQATPAQQTASAASAATGIATDAAVSQLYAGTPIPVAWQPQPSRTMHDGPTIDQIALTRSAGSDAPPAPSIGTSTVLDHSMYQNPAWVGGTIAWSADQTGLNAGWYHVSISFDNFTVTDENGNTTTIASGGFEIYVHDNLVSNDGNGNWERIVDHYPSVPSGSPLVVSVTCADGSVHGFSLVGQRHADRDIHRSKVAVTDSITSVTTTTITRHDAVTVDGDYSALGGSGASFTPATDPSLPDRGSNTRVFTNWAITGSGAGSHSLVWNRYCTYDITWQSSYTTGSPSFTWSGTVSNRYDNVYLTLDGVQTGPYDDVQLRALFGTVMNLNRAGSGM